MCRPRHNNLTAPLLAAVTWAALGCGDESQPPTGPAELGESPAASSTVAAAATSPLQFSQISSGARFTCGLATNGQAFCWGINFAGQLGDGTTGGSRARPHAVATSLRFRQITTGSSHTCAVTTDDLAYCWGDNSGGQLGDKTTTPRTTPVRVLGGHKFRDVRGGFSATCGVATTGESYCWGTNLYGEIGDNTIINRLVPRLVRGGHSFRRIVAGSGYACGVTTADKAYCWGRNDFGQLGDGTTTERHLPTPVVGNRGFKNVSASTLHTCGFTKASAVYCWGYNTDGAVGDGSTTHRPRPVLAKTTGALDGVSSGGSHACALRSDGHVLCWGSNQLGQVGDATTITPRLLPVQVVGSGNYDAIHAGFTHTCGLTVDRFALCWGANEYGQLGRGFYSQKEGFPQGVEPPL
jgi:alpha-tubulin suppressor-like RCC1 family protein